MTPRKELSLPSLSLGLTQQEYQQLRTPLAPSRSEETIAPVDDIGAFSEATRLGQVGVPQVGVEFSDGTRLAQGPGSISEEPARDATRLGTLAWKVGEEADRERPPSRPAETSEATRLKNSARSSQLPLPPKPSQSARPRASEPAAGNRDATRLGNPAASSRPPLPSSSRPPQSPLVPQPALPPKPPQAPQSHQVAQAPQPPNPPLGELAPDEQDMTRLGKPAASALPPPPPKMPEPPPIPPVPPSLPSETLDYTRRAPSPRKIDETRLRKEDDHDPDTP